MNYSLDELVLQYVFAFSLILCRLGALIMSMPGISELYVPIKIRVTISIISSFLIFPIILPVTPAIPISPVLLGIMLVNETLIGVFFGSIVRILVNATQIIGNIISTQSSLGSAVLFDPNQGTQNVVIGNFFTALSVVLLFSTNIHYLLIDALVKSYSLFAPGKLLLIGDMSETIIKVVSISFEIALKLSAPVIIISILIMIASGVLSRLMPNMQILFIITPVQILVSFTILSMTISSGMIWYISYINDNIGNFILYMGDH